MTKTNKTSVKSSFEGKALILLSFLFIGVLAASWMYAMNLRQTVARNNSAVSVDSAALIEIEKLRNLVDSQLDNSRSYFLLGSKSLFDKQKKDREDLLEAVATFEKEFNLPKVPEQLKRVQAAMQQQQEFFDQGMEFREKQTESKIIGQFYQSKTNTVRNEINEALNEMAQIHKMDLEQARQAAKTAAVSVESRIPEGMTWLTTALGGLFFLMAMLVVKMIVERAGKRAERERLYEEAKKAVHARDEVLAAVAQDLNAPLDEIKKIADDLVNSKDLMEDALLITSTVSQVEALIRDIVDQKDADLERLALRLDQLNVDDVMEDARLVLQPLAKKRDIRLQFDTGNPPALAFFDRERVIRVLFNLVGNAIQFSPKHSKITIRVRSDQQFVTIAVMDASEVNVDELEKNGVGFAIAKTIVEAHEGTLKADRSGGGNVFTFTLPRRRPVGAQLRKPAAPTVRISRPRGSDPQVYS